MPAATRIRLASAKPDLLEQLQSKLVGQDQTLAQIVPFVRMHRAGLSPEGRPVGVFLLLGPTGTGKTRTVEVLAGALHGSEKCLLRVDCGEFQMEHEVAKLIGAPPGYLGHRETQPMLTQQKLSASTSEDSNLSLLLFDEIEKAAPSLQRLLLGMLDKAILRLGDNSTVNFERTMIFMTSNLGADAMRKALVPDFGFEALVGSGSVDTLRTIQDLGLAAVKRKFSPEFVNRIDAVVAYAPLEEDSLRSILGLLLKDLQVHLDRRLTDHSVTLHYEPAALDWLLTKGTSKEYGARELKRTLLRNVTQPLAALIDQDLVEPGSEVLVDVEDGKLVLDYEVA